VLAPPGGAGGIKARRRRRKLASAASSFPLSPSPSPISSPENTQVVQDAGYDEDYLVSNVKITLGVMA